MFESLEDLVEQSVNLNYEVYPLIEGLRRLLEEKGEEYTIVRNQAIHAHEKLQEFLTKLEANTGEEGGINLDDFEERKLH